MDSIGRRLRVARVKAGLQQTDVVRELGVSRVSVSNWERDVSMPSDENLEALAKLYHTSARDLRYGDAEYDQPTAVPNRVMERAAERARRAAIPQGVRVWLQEFQLELTKAGASEEEVQWAMRLLDTNAFGEVVGSLDSGIDEQRWLEALETMGSAIRIILKEPRLSAKPEPPGASKRVSSKDYVKRKKKGGGGAA